MNISKNCLRIFGLLLFVVIVVKLDPHRISHVILKADFAILGIALILVIPLMMLKSWRWQYLLAMQGFFISFKESFAVYLEAFYVGLITPGRLGEFIKALYLKEKKGVSIGEGFSSVLIDRLQDVLPFIVVGLLGLILSPFGESYLYLIIGIMLLFLLIWILVFKAKVWKKIVQRVVRELVPKKYRNSVDVQLDSFFTGIGKFRDFRMIVPVIATIASAALVFLQCYLIAISLSISVSFVYLAFCVSVAGLASLIPVSIYGLGTREATLIGLFSRVGLSSESAVVFSLIYLMVFGLFTATIGALIWFVSPIKIESGKMKAKALVRPSSSIRNRNGETYGRNQLDGQISEIQETNRGTR